MGEFQECTEERVVSQRLYAIEDLAGSIKAVRDSCCKTRAVAMAHRTALSMSLSSSSGLQYEILPQTR